MRHVALVGLGPGGENAPKDMERWGMPWGGDLTMQRYFDPHKEWRTIGYYRNEPVGYLGAIPAKVFMDKVEPDVPNSRRYPFEYVHGVLGTAYYEGTIAYMLALAIALGIPKITLYGVSGDEGYAQRANVEYLIGLGRGRGLSINVAEPTKLLKSEFDEGRYC